jgi:hypothetical protein
VLANANAVVCWALLAPEIADSMQWPIIMIQEVLDPVDIGHQHILPQQVEQQ